MDILVIVQHQLVAERKILNDSALMLLMGGGQLIGEAEKSVLAKTCRSLNTHRTRRTLLPYNPSNKYNRTQLLSMKLCLNETNASISEHWLAKNSLLQDQKTRTYSNNEIMKNKNILHHINKQLAHIAMIESGLSILMKTHILSAKEQKHIGGLNRSKVVTHGCKLLRQLKNNTFISFKDLLGLHEVFKRSNTTMGTDMKMRLKTNFTDFSLYREIILKAMKNVNFVCMLTTANICELVPFFKNRDNINCLKELVGRGMVLAPVKLDIHLLHLNYDNTPPLFQLADIIKLEITLHNLYQGNCASLAPLSDFVLWAEEEKKRMNQILKMITKMHFHIIENEEYDQESRFILEHLFSFCDVTFLIEAYDWGYIPVGVNNIHVRKLDKKYEIEDKHDIQKKFAKIIPDTVESISFDHYADFDIPKHILPTKLKILNFASAYNFNGNISEQKELPNLKTLQFGSKFNNNTWPNIKAPNLETLIFGNCFNKPIKTGELPSNLTVLRFGRYFNQNIDEDVLPKSLKTLRFGFDYNQGIGENVLPKSLQTLTFGYAFNQEICRNSLPRSLRKLTFGHRFNKKINPNILPPNLEVLHFGRNFNQAFCRNVLPPSLKKLTFGHKFNHTITLDILPLNLEVLHFGRNFNRAFCRNVLPPSLKTLTFGHKFNQHFSINTLPKSLQMLKLGRDYNESINAGVLPVNLRVLINQSLHKFDIIYPRRLEELKYVGNSFEGQPPSMCSVVKEDEEDWLCSEPFEMETDESDTDDYDY